MSNITPSLANSSIPGSPSKKKKPMARPPARGVVLGPMTMQESVDSISTVSTGSSSSSHFSHEKRTSTSHNRPPLRTTAVSSSTSAGSSSSSTGSSSLSTSSSAVLHLSKQGSTSGQGLNTGGGPSVRQSTTGSNHSSYHAGLVDERGYSEDDSDMDEATDRFIGHHPQRHSGDTTTYSKKKSRRHRRRRRGDRHSSDSNSSDSGRQPGLYGKAHIKGRYKIVRMILLTTSLMGLQFTWAVEMAYGTPFLLQLGLSKSLMSLVWLAGPLSGLVMQPIVGVLSDRCTSRFGRRRPFLAVGVAAVVCSFLCLGWCREIMAFVFGQDYAGLDVVTILMAVVSIYILDFAINCVQASCRTLIVDSLPSSQQEEAAAWASRLMGLGGIFGYFMGNVNLPEVLPAFGNTQIKGLCIVACLFLVFNVGLTCWAVTERVMVRATSSSSSTLSEFLGGFRTIFQSIRHLPLQIQPIPSHQHNTAPSPTLSSSGWWRQHKPRWLKLPIPWLTLPRMYTLSLALVSLSLLSTWIIQDIRGSTILFSLCGISWAVSMWAPFSILGEVISQQLQEQQHQERMRGSGGGGVETMFDADAHFDANQYTMQGVVVEDEEGQEEIRMVENKRYRPVEVHVDTSYHPTSSTVANTTQVRSRNSTPLTTPVLNVGEGDPWSHHPRSSNENHTVRGGHVHGSSSLASIDTVVSNTFKEDHAYHHRSEGIRSDEVGRDSMEEETLEGGDEDEEAQKLVQSQSSESSLPSHRRRDVDVEAQRGQNCDGSSIPSVGTSAGALLGIHNIYIVLPQFLVSFLSSLVFAAIDKGTDANKDSTGGATAEGVEGDQPADPNTIGVMLRFGGLMAGIAALLSLRLWRSPALGGRW
ncbi:hypothetical protein BGW42_004693 [Actinomortierella wolfii]|nr:hypothetical protein BGW42_004693 [Actinomortierella wolfii]